MNSYKADLHIHSLLSPCGSLEMTPAAIIERAREEHLNILAITDHNSTRQVPVVQQLGIKAGLLIICGAEVTTREEVHCLVLLPDEVSRLAFQAFLDHNLPPIANDPGIFGYQVVVDAGERIEFEEPKLLLSALTAGLEEVAKVVHSLGGLFIPAHVERPRFSIISQLGFIPEALQVDAIELTATGNARRALFADNVPAGIPIIRNSDAHYLHQIGNQTTEFRMEGLDFLHFATALRSKMS